MHYPYLGTAFGTRVAIYATDRAVILTYSDAPHAQPTTLARVEHHPDRIDLTLSTGQRCTVTPRVCSRRVVRTHLAAIRAAVPQRARITSLAPYAISLFRHRAPIGA